MTPTDRLALCQAEAARFRRMAASCAAASRTEDRAEHAGTMAALAWLAADFDTKGYHTTACGGWSGGDCDCSPKRGRPPSPPEAVRARHIRVPVNAAEGAVAARGAGA